MIIIYRNSLTFLDGIGGINMRILNVEIKLPKKAGDVDVDYSDRVTTPLIKEGKITVPLALGVGIYPICNGMQIIIDAKNKRNRCYFGGTDNSPEKTPFLTEVEADKLSIFFNEGEEAFYDSFIPDEIEFFSRHSGNHFQKQLFGTKELQKYPSIIKRQGDIFAVPVPYDGEEIEILIGLIDSGENTVCYHEFCQTKIDGNGIRLFSTRHTLKGEYISGERFYIAKGIISAPDHHPLILTDRFHLVMRAEGVIDDD
ncbi:MAG: hypothetical protein AAB621_00440 [Patescibacteria group bacterium]